MDKQNSLFGNDDDDTELPVRFIGYTVPKFRSCRRRISLGVLTASNCCVLRSVLK